MKIGEFSKKNNVSIDTLRHYIDLGLLVPLKKGRLFTFDISCQKDYELIISLKSFNFNLSQIQHYFNIKRIGCSSKEDEVNYLKTLLKNKIDVFDDEISDLIHKREEAKSYLNELEIIEDSPKIAFDITEKMLELLNCPKCHSAYTFKQVDHGAKSVYKNGVLDCSCGDALEIFDGIIIGQENFKKRYSSGDICALDFYQGFVKNSSREFLNDLYFGIRWLSEAIERYLIDKDDSPQIYIEFGVGAGIFLRQYMKNLNQDIYIAVDHDIERLKALKQTLEESGYQKNVLFICADYEQIPLKHGVGDFIIDYYSSMSYALESDKPMINLIRPYCNSNSLYCGVHALTNFSQLNHDLVKNDGAFIENEILNNLHQIGFVEEEKYLSKMVEDQHLMFKSFFLTAKFKT